MAAETGSATSSEDRWVAVAGVAFVVLFMVGMILMFGTPENDAPAPEWRAYFDDSGNRAKSILGLLLASLGALAFLGFALGAWRRVRTDGDGLIASIGGGAAVVYTALILVGVASIGSVAGSVQFGEVSVPPGELSRNLEALGVSIVLVAASYAAAAFVFAVSWLGRQSSALPGWLTIVGYVVAVALLAGFLFFPVLLFFLWILAVSVAVFVDSRVEPPASLQESATH